LREGTPATKLAEKVPVEERCIRSAHLRRLSADKRMSFYQKQTGRVLRVLLENPKGGFHSWCTDYYVRVVVPQSPLGLENQMALIKLGKATPEFVDGEIVSFEKGGKN
jgi:threonylcarbamoyladenosine tRNA methylthiotransferase MtaB